MKKNETFSGFSLTQMRRGSCSAKGIAIAGRTFVPDEDVGYVEFFLAHAFPLIIEGTALHPQVVANSYRTLENKVFNFAHMMRSADKTIKQDRILGTVVAVEFPETPAYCPHCEGAVNYDSLPEISMGAVECPGCKKSITQGELVLCWKVGASVADAPCIRAVAVLHKAAEGVQEILQLWAEGKTSAGKGDWTVSMENEVMLGECGFLVKLGGAGRWDWKPFLAVTPENVQAMGYVYVPAQSAPQELLDCVNDDDDDAREKNTSIRIVRDYLGQKVILLLGGIAGAIRFRGVGLTPLGKDFMARVGQMIASKPLVDMGALMKPLHDFADVFISSGNKK